jgi:PAS domain S-box-containing protein
MDDPLRVLILEDRITDTEIMLHELQQAGFRPKATRVETEADYGDQLSPELDVILADYTLPQFDALSALELLQQRGLDIPFLVVSGSISEEVAVTCMRQGASDYLLKDRLTRLGPAVRAALAQKQLRQDKRRTEAALHDSEHLFRLLAENASDLISRHTPRGICLYASPACRTLLGYDAEELLWRSACDFIHPDDAVEISKTYAALATAPDVCTLTYRIRRKDGQYVWFETASRTLWDAESGAASEIHAVSRDITARKQAEEQVKASLREKEVLLREIHHRVKNNLQIITSLLNLQAGYVEDQQARALFKESQHRVKSMALVHETLYQSKDLGKIDMAVYIRNLVNHLGRCYAVQSEGVDLKIDVADVFLGIDTAVPCALLINELVSNSIKHAFPTAKGGEISVDFRSGPDGRFMLTVADNGRGLPRDIDLKHAKSLGLQLVSALTDQLGAAVDLSNRGGTTFKITFAELKYKER